MKHLLCLLPLLFLTHLPLLAQRKTIDEILPQLAHSKEDTNKVILLNRLVSFYTFAAPDSGKLFANQAIALSDKLNFPKGKIDALLHLGLMANKVDLQQAFILYDSALFLATKINDEKRVAHAYSQIGRNYTAQGNFAKSTEYLSKALKIMKKIGDKKEITNILSAISRGYIRQELREEAFVVGQEALEIAEEIQDKPMIASTLMIVGDYYCFKKELSKGMGYLERALTIRKELGDKQGMMNSLNSIGDYYRKIKDYPKAFASFSQSYQIALQLNNKQVQAYAPYKLALTHYTQGQHQDSVIYYAEKSFEVAKAGNFFIEIKEAVELLHKTYANLKQHSKAYHYFTIFHSLNDSIINIDNAKKIKEMKVDFELEKKEKEIALLNTQNELQAEESKNQKLLLYLFALGLLGLAVVAFLVFRSKEKEKKAKLLLQQQNEVIEQKNKDLQEKNDQIEAQNEEITSQNEEIVQQNEEISMQSEKLEELNKMKDKLFSVIAHDLRSPIASLKNTLHTSHLEGLSTDDLRQINVSLNHQLANVDNTVETLLQWARVQMAVVKPNPQNFPLFAVADEIVSFLQETANKKQVEIESEIPENVLVYADINHIRIALRNVLANAVKFSYEKGKIMVNAIETADNEQIIISIKDEGTGMTAAQFSLLFTINMSSQRGTAGEKGTGLGLILCKEFIERNGGQIWVESEEGKGSIFYFTINKGCFK
ncbi:MAG: ATP-binding protein [Thermoflexibacter sp.]|nr:ATP-binding protein [Thermoflexibacter sp.]